MAPGGVLIVHPGALGDVVLALGPVSRVPRPVWLAVRGSVTRLAPWVPAVERWIDLEGPWGPALVGNGDGSWPAELAGLGEVVVLRSDPDGELESGLSRVLRTRAIVASAQPTQGMSAHRHVARLLGVSPEPMERPWIAVGAVRVPGEVVIHPGSGGRAKRWSIDGFLTVARILAARSTRITWILGEAELDVGLDRGLRGDVLRAPALEEVAPILARAGAYLGNDSGVSHLAAAVGTPSVLVFGPTSPQTWAPAAPWVDAVRGDPAADPIGWTLDPDHVAHLVLAAANG